MKQLILTCAALCLSAAPALALDTDLEELNRAVFDSVDKNGDGLLSLREVDQFRRDVMLSQDADDDGIVTREEHLAWDMGWAYLAEARGVAARYWRAREAVFEAWDQNSDGALNEGEQHLSQAKDFYTAGKPNNEPLDYEAFKTGLQIMAEMNGAFAVEGEVTLINVFEVPEGMLEETVAMWTQSRDFLQTQPGYISTALHRSVGPDARYQLINIAKWDSIDAFDAATAAMRTEAGIAPVEGLSFTPGLYQVVATD